MKKALSLFLAILTVMSLVTVFSSCKKEPETPEVVIENFEVVTGKNDACTIVYAYNTADGMNNTRRMLAESIQQFVYAKTGTKPKVVDDRTAESEGFEILIGDTNRAISSSVKAEITDNRTYIIRVADKKLVIQAPSFTLMEEAVNLFIADGSAKKLRYKLSTQNGTMSFKNGYDYTFTLPAVVTNVKHLGYITSLADAGTHFVVQGGCSDGTYLYACLEDQKSDSGDPDYYYHTEIHTTVIYKVRLDTMEVVKKSEPLHLDHSNDMAYNSKTNELVVVHCGMNPDKPERSKLLSYINPETLEINATVEGAFEGGYAMAYEASRDVFVTATGNYYKIYDGFYKNAAGGYIPLTRTMTDTSIQNSHKGHITQGIDCDEKYIYNILTGDGEDNINDRQFGYLVITTWEGKVITTCRVPLPEGENMEIETEFIFHIGNTFYVGYNARNTQVGHIHSFTVEGLE